MPSPTSSTRPTSRTSILESYCSISCWRTEAISSALNFMDTPMDHLRPNPFQLRGNGRVVDGVADTDHDAGDQVGIDLSLQPGFRRQYAAQLRSNALRLVVRQRRGRGDLYADPTAQLIELIMQGAIDGFQ